MLLCLQLFIAWRTVSTFTLLIWFDFCPSFLAEKPYSHQGPIITIKLSENTETVTASDGTQQMQLVEMLFEMNYDSGHWRRLKRTRVVSKHGASSTSIPGQKSTWLITWLRKYIEWGSTKLCANFESIISSLFPKLTRHSQRSRESARRARQEE